MADTSEQRPAKKAGSQVSLATAGAAIRRHPILFAVILATAAAAGGAVWVFMPLPKHTAAVVFHIAGTAPRVFGSGGAGEPDPRSYREQQVATIKRRIVLNAALNQPEMPAVFAQDPNGTDTLDRKLQVDFKSGPEFMRVLIEGDQPDELLGTVKAVTAAYLKEIGQREKGSREARLESIEKSYNLQASELSSKHKKIDLLLGSLGSGDSASLAVTDTFLHDDLRQARKESQELQRQLELAKAEQLGMEKLLRPTVAPAVLDNALRADPILAVADAQVLAAQKAVEFEEGRYGPGSQNATVLKARSELKTAQEKRDQLRAEVRGRLEAGAVAQATADAAVALEKLKDRIQRLEFLKAQADSQVKEFRQVIAKKGEHRVELEKIQKDIAHQEKILMSLAEERDRMRLDKETASRVTIAEPPFVVAGVEGFRRLRTAGVVSGGLLLVGASGLFWWESRARRVTRSDEVAQALGLPLLGTLPSSIADGPDAQRHLIESIDSTRTTLLTLATPDRRLRTLMVTSALAGEGKSCLSGHLAISLARAGYRVLLVDGDMHRPSLHALFDQPTCPGLCELLSDESLAPAAIRTTPVPNLCLLPTGAWEMSVRQALLDGRWTRLRARLESDFDFVVLDSGPILLVNDSQLLAQGVDGIVLSVLVGVSKHVATTDAQARLTAIGGRLLGVVVNGVRSAYDYSYYQHFTKRPAGPEPVPLTPTAEGRVDAPVA